MPKTGSQITLCDIPVRFDTYEGCSHACRYCFVNRKRDISQIHTGEGADSLRAFIEGSRTGELTWCDWNIPIHFGGMSDPFQPIERIKKKTLAALQVLAETQYPYVISTKNALIAEEPYLSLIKSSNVVVQFSAACKEYDEIEKGASPFEMRLQAMRAISPYKRVIVRVQPYVPDFKQNILRSLSLFAEAGAYGITIEGMKYIKAKAGTIKLGGDHVYPAPMLRKDYAEIKQRCHELGLRFYCAENRLRTMGDDLCCCGIDGLGWQTNTGNLVHMLYDRGGVRFSKGQRTQDTRVLLHMVKQHSLVGVYGEHTTFEQLMRDMYRVKAELRPLIAEDLVK